MYKVRAWLALTLDTMAASMVSVGSYLIYPAAGVIVGGFSCAVLAWVVETINFKEKGDDG
jgi:hypothetical protein